MLARILTRHLRLAGPGCVHSATSSVATKAAMAGVAASDAKRVIRGVVFDMDGTVTIPVLDFAEMRRRCGVPEGRDILDVINGRPQHEREAAYAVIAEMEDEALVNMKIMPGAHQLLSTLDKAGIPRGLITRNVMRSVSHFHENHITAMGLAPFSPSISRECNFAYKPSPEALLHICETWGIPPSEAVMVGDSVKDDIVCGNRAGAVTVLLDYNGVNGYAAAPHQLQGERSPTHIVHTLTELADYLSNQCILMPPPNPHAAVEPASGTLEPRK